MDKSKMAVGEAVIEFYASLDIIRDYYENRGYKKMTLLHKLLKEQLNWKMGYDTFRYHFNKEFKKSKLSNSNSTLQEKQLKEESARELLSKEKAHEPIVATFSMSDLKPFNPHTSDIDESKILR